MTRTMVMKKLGSFKAVTLALLGFVLMAFALLAVWQISRVEFVPALGSVDLTETSMAEVRLDSTVCPASIKDRMVMEDIVDETLQTLLWNCVEQMRDGGAKVVANVRLPHEWRQNEALALSSASGRVLYSIDYQVDYWPDSGLGLWSIAITGAGHNLAVFLNGHLLGWSGSFEIPYARNHARPLLFTVTDGLLKEGSNDLDIYVISETPAKAYLGKVYFAPTEMLLPAYSQYHFFRFILPQIISWSTAVLAALMAALWLYRRRDVEYGLFGLICLLWSVHTLDQFLVEIPMATRHWDWLMQISLGLMLACSIVFIHRFLGLRRRIAESLLWLGTAFSALVLAILPQEWVLPVVNYFWYPLLVIAAFYVLVSALQRLPTDVDFERVALTTAVAIIFLLLCHDLMVQLGWLPVYHGELLHFGAPFLLLAFTWILLRRFVFSLNAAEQLNNDLQVLNTELESRVEEKSQRIAQSYEMIRQLGQERVVQEERSRIMRDMHDGIGVYLTSMLRQLDMDALDRDHLRDSAKSALNDLRLMIDSLGSASNDLPAMLGMFRTRITALLDACQGDLAWDVDELPDPEDFGPEKALNLLRILQEAVTNALKHSEASLIRLSAEVETIDELSGRILIKVQDNGKGFTVSYGLGNGLKNMRHRARKIGAGFHMESEGAGTLICVSLPVVKTELSGRPA